jgi:hypothetical protein
LVSIPSLASTDVLQQTYVAAQSDVELVINAANRFYALNQTYPTSLQALVANNELRQAFVDSSRQGYTIDYNAENGDCAVTAVFTSGNKVVVNCSDPNYNAFIPD